MEETGNVSLHRYFTAGKVVVTLIFISGWWFGHWGIFCDREHMPKGLCLMSCFSALWTIFVIYQFRSNEMMSLKKDAFKKMIVNSKDMALDSKKKDYDQEAM